MEAGGYFYAAAKYAAPEHGGTHMDAPVHFNREGMTVDQVPLAAMVLVLQGYARLHTAFVLVAVSVVVAATISLLGFLRTRWDR